MTSILKSDALTTYARAKAEIQAALNVTLSDDTYQNAIELLINAVSDAVVRYCGREFAYGSRTDTLPPPQDERVIVACPPIATASSLAPTATLDGSAVSDVEIEDATQGYLWCEGGWGGTSFDSVSGVSQDTLPGSAKRVLVVTYTGGYVLPSATVGTRDLPWDIELAVLQAVCLAWKFKQSGYAADAQPEVNSVIGRGAGGILPDIILPTLDRYRRVVTFCG